MKKIIKIFLPILAIFSLWFLFCFPYVGKGLIPFPSTYLVTFFPPWSAWYGMPVKNNAMPDVITQIYPWKQITIDSLKQGQIPLWNPFSFAGTVHAGNYQSAIFSPFNVIFFLFSFIDAWSIFILLQPLLAGLGTYLFLRSLDRSKSGSLVGSVAFMFCGFMTTWMAYGTLGYVALCLPWALWAITRYIKKGSVWFLPIISLSLMTSFFAGHFQISLYVLGAVIAYILFLMISARKWRQGMLLMVYVALGMMLASPQILLTIDAYTASTRSTSFVKGEVIPWKYLVTLFSPDFYGNPVTRNDWFGHYAEWASYVGIIPLILAVFAIVRKLKGYTRFFAVLSCFSIFLAYPTPLNDLLYALRLPAISTSAASRIIILFSFSLATLSAFGLDELVRTWKEKRMRSIMPFVIGWGIFLSIVWIVLFLGKPFPIEKLAIAKRNLLLPTALTGATLFIMAFGCIKKFKVYVLLILFLLGLGMFDSYRYVSKWMPFDKREYMYPQQKFTTFLQEQIGYNRAFGNLYGEFGMTYQIPLIDGYDAMYQGRYGEFINVVSNGIVSPGDRSVVSFDKYGRYKEAGLQLLGVRYIIHRLSDGKMAWVFPVWQYEPDIMKSIYKDDQYEIYEYKDAFPRTFLASSYEVITDSQEIADRLFAPPFDRRNSLILEKDPGLQLEKGSGEAQIVKYSPNAITIKTTSDTNKLLFLSDIYDAGWQATIDGKKTEVFRADYDFRAVAVPSGLHTIEYRYQPYRFRMGVIVVGIGVVIGLVACLWIKKQKS